MPQKEQAKTTFETPDHASNKLRRHKIRGRAIKVGAEVVASAAVGLSLVGALSQTAHARILEGGPSAPLINKGGPKPNHPLNSVANRPGKFIREEIGVAYTEVYKSPIGEIEIIGNDNFIEQTRAALDLLQFKAPDYFKMVVDNMGIILRVKTGSSIQVEKTPPRFFASDRLFESGTAWYAGDIVHDANHARQWRTYHYAHHPNEIVPRDVYYGEKAERECIAVQAKALAEIGAPQDQIDWLVEHAADSRYWDTPANAREY